ncbi:MAG: iron-sulfur cluster assembly accessory protein [Gemmatimonadales bacterium]|nr:MAG: iron-sulfur cluster assembly accessory protein [Gemmatimonadales bacterium]
MLTFTDKARNMVRTFMDQSEGELEALRIVLTGGSPVAPAFELTLVGPDDRSGDDVEVDGGGFTVLVDKSSADRLDGANVDFVQRVNESGFEITPATPSRPVEAPKGAIADKVQTVLDQQVNPQIASHGGKILLVDVKDTEIYMEMTGGCQGCAMSRMTLRQGVEKMIRQAVPEITAIHDVTDHASGENPYFSA